MANFDALKVKVDRYRRKLVEMKIPKVDKMVDFEMGDPPNVYFDGQVVSWSLVGSQAADVKKELKKDSTIGSIYPRTETYTFPTEFLEEVTIVRGQIYAKVGETGPETLFKPYRTISAPPKTNLYLTIRGSKAVLYVCQYK